MRPSAVGARGWAERSARPQSGEPLCPPVRTWVPPCRWAKLTKPWVQAELTTRGPSARTPWSLTCSQPPRIHRTCAVSLSPLLEALMVAGQCGSRAPVFLGRVRMIIFEMRPSRRQWKHLRGRRNPNSSAGKVSMCVCA